MMVEDMTGTEKERKMAQILGVENELLDCILEEQQIIHESVKTRSWSDLEDALSHMEAFSDAFVSVDASRDALAGKDGAVYFLPQVEPLFVQVRTKLAKSKIENQALSGYVHATQDFLTGILDECVPQERNTLYSSTGEIKKPVMQSVVVNKLY